MTDIVLIAHNLRSTHNVGSLLRTAEGLGVQEVILSGYTPYPLQRNDSRLPHIAQKLDKQIAKTALGAEKQISWRQATDLGVVIYRLKSKGYQVVAIEQSDDSVPLPDYTAAPKVAVIVGREVEGIESEVLGQCDLCLEIPMFGQKESFNVVQAAAMSLYQIRFCS